MTLFRSIRYEQRNHVDEAHAANRIAADADAGRLAEAILRGLIDGFIGQRAGPRHDPDLARLVNVSRHDADLAFARRDHARTVRTDQHGVRILRAQRGLDLDHVVDRDAFGDADAHLDAGIGRFEDRSEEHTSELQSLMRISYAV